MNVLLGSGMDAQGVCKAAPGAVPRVGYVNSVTLARGEIWSRRVHAAGSTLTCHEGWVWLTREGDARDYVLAAGDSVRLDKPGLVVVQALRTARFELQRAAVAQAPRRLSGRAGTPA